jgi:hypothetical protein
MSKHPLPKGTTVTLVEEVSDFDANEVERITPIGAIGMITGRGNERSDGEPGFCYDLEFPNGAWLTVDDCDLDDPSRFTVNAS